MSARVFFARYMAVSASCSRVAVFMPGRPAALMPTLAWTWKVWSARAIGVASAACIRWSTVRAWAGVVRGRIADMDLLDVAVVCGGQAGLAIARRLRRLGLRFLVLDASPEIGQAGSVSGSASHPKPALPIGQAQQ